jgi:hypothetical protein
MAHDKNAVNITSASAQVGAGFSEAALSAEFNSFGFAFKNLFKNANLTPPEVTNLQSGDGLEGAKDNLGEGLKNQKSYHVAIVSAKIQSMTSMMGTIDTSTSEGMAHYNYCMGQIRMLEQEKNSLMPLEKYSYYRYS